MPTITGKKRTFPGKSKYWESVAIGLLKSPWRQMKSKHALYLVYHIIRGALQRLTCVYKLLKWNGQGLIGNVFQTLIQVYDND